MNKPPACFNDVTLFDGIRREYTIVIPRKILGVWIKYGLKEHITMEISKVLLNKRGIKIANNNRHLLIWENGNTCMLKHIPVYDQVSIDGCISLGGQGSDDVYSYHSELQDAYFVKSKRKIISFDTLNTKYYKKYLEKIQNGTIKNMGLCIRQYPTQLSSNSENFYLNPMILGTNIKIESKPGDRIAIGYIEHTELLVLSKDKEAIVSETIIANNGESHRLYDGIIIATTSINSGSNVAIDYNLSSMFPKCDKKHNLVSKALELENKENGTFNNNSNSNNNSNDIMTIPSKVHNNDNTSNNSNDDNSDITKNNNDNKDDSKYNDDVKDVDDDPNGDIIVRCNDCLKNMEDVTDLSDQYYYCYHCYYYCEIREIKKNEITARTTTTEMVS